MDIYRRKHKRFQVISYLPCSLSYYLLILVMINLTLDEYLSSLKNPYPSYQVIISLFLNKAVDVDVQ